MITVMTPDLLGYSSCGCGTLVPDHVAHLTAGRCVPCHRAHLEDQLHPIEIIVRGTRTAVARADVTPAERRRRTAKNRSRYLKRKHDAAHKRRRNLAEHARRRALKRLKNHFPEVYDLLLAEERAKMGLDSYTPHRAAVSAAATEAYKTLSGSGIYHPGDAARSDDDPAAQR